MDAHLYWPGIGSVQPDELVLRKLLPLAHDGLRSCGMSDAARERYLAVIEQRCVTRRTGASWQRATVQTLTDRGANGQPRWPACCAVTSSTCTPTNRCTPGR